MQRLGTATEIAWLMFLLETIYIITFYFQHAKKFGSSCYIKQRHVLAIMAFSAIFHVFVLRANLSMAIVAMVNDTAYTSDVNATATSYCPERSYNESIQETQVRMLLSIVCQLHYN